MAEKKEAAKAAEPAPTETMRVTINCPSPGAKVFTSMGTLGNGACVKLPKGEARRFISLGKARLTEATEDAPGADVVVAEDRPLA